MNQVLFQDFVDKIVGHFGNKVVSHFGNKLVSHLGNKVVSRFDRKSFEAIKMLTVQLLKAVQMKIIQFVSEIYFITNNPKNLLSQEYVSQIKNFHFHRFPVNNFT